MHLHADRLYHIYNRGNNRKLLFYERRNYEFFLKKVERYIAPYCDVLAYSLLPNHFHFLIHANERTVAPWYRQTWDGKIIDVNSGIPMSQFSRGLQLCLSSYAKAINNQYNRTGSLFTQNTRCKQTSNDSLMEDYSVWCFKYVHNNPVAAGLVTSPEQWPYSSFREYAGLSPRVPLCNLDLGIDLLRLDINQLSSYNQVEIPDYFLSKIL